MPARATSPEIAALIQLGLTDLEAQLYLAMVGREAQTAHALARDGGWHKANTYKALESLTTKGAVSLIDGDRREWKAVPAEEFLASCEAAASRAASQVREALARRASAPADDRVFELRAVGAVLERAKAMLAEAEVMVVLDAFPTLLEALRPELEAAAARGVRVGVRAYEDTHLAPEVEIFPAANGDRILGDWDGQIMAIASDGERYLVAHMDEQMRTVRQAFHTASPYLSMMASNGIASEMVLGALAAPGERSARRWAADARAAVEAADTFDTAYSPGRNRLARRRRGPGDHAS